ncbi:hypothetical protein BO78DRAFT_412610 [Aspergillus sclerotiicarbonarius CBS 121057]|uniref:Uncharacterized protein n=1 Tax=Aspergillus sclerotiicarbonarius (strain CBS 121057 / IBT 28362) TaxID=1448318 RepID=A0A319EWF8_ASPSB|nr:hypothetical protein BO78DRAFT_412610 [Aspergillus sclerotiicarbonarius CBS 121057]
MVTNRTKIPHSETKWREMITAEGLADSSIHTEQLASASKFEFRHFLLLRVLWKSIPGRVFDPKQFDLADWIAPAKEIFGGQIKEGNFFLAKLFQLEAASIQSKEADIDIYLSPVSSRTRQKLQQKDQPQEGNPGPHATPTKSNWVGGVVSPHVDEEVLDDIKHLNLDDSSWLDQTSPFTNDSPGPEELLSEMYPRSKDEQIVNTALVNFLKALTAHFDLSSDWTIHRKAFKAKFHNTEYEARLDGYLGGKASGEVRALIEVKSALRRMKSVPIRIQESAQMVAWIKETLATPRMLPGRHFHVSKGRHEIWLIFAEYDEGYLKFLAGEEKADDPLSFMTMYEVGPFNTQDGSHMGRLGPILLALTLRADHDRQIEEAKDADQARLAALTQQGKQTQVEQMHTNPTHRVEKGRLAKKLREVQS